MKKREFLICGAGRFGSRAVNILSRIPEKSLTIIDHAPEQLDRIKNTSFIRLQADVIDYLARNRFSINPESKIIPAITHHLAFGWIAAVMTDNYNVNRIDVPLDLIEQLPHPWVTSTREIICSHADFICPEDCSEPEEICTVTGRPRGIPLFEMVTGLHPPGYRTAVIRSRQIGPGVGGYPFSELLLLKKRIAEAGKGKWMIGTACRCHGILSALEIK